MKYIIHVNQLKIRSNIKNDLKEPVLTCKSYKDNQYGHEVLLKDKSSGKVLATFKYSPDKPLSCGARVWFEFDDSDLDFEVVDNTEEK